jgi:hypothetical protein
VKRVFALAALAISAMTTEPLAAAPADTLDKAARDYVLLSLTIGEKENGYIDAYYGPPELKAQAKVEAPSQDLAALSMRAEALRARVHSFASARAAPVEAKRVRFLEGQLTAAVTRLRMLRGEHLAFADEAEGLFGVRPKLAPLATFDPLLATIEALVPGPGPLAARVDAFNDRFDIPADKLRPTMDAAIAECRKRSGAHVALPAGEHFELGLVTGKPWGGYNYYLGNYTSRIEINTDLPVRLSRAVDLGCHEGYPGHHAFNVLLEQKLVRGRGWIEFTVYPLYSPQSFIAEGSANYGIHLSFPGPDMADFVAGKLASVAGFDPAEVRRFVALQDALETLAPARFTIAQQFLDGSIDEAEALRLLQKYQLISPERAAKGLEFDKHYRSYVINYGLGQDMVREAVERGGADEATRWQRMATILSEPTVPADLQQR